jgi:hypothetical protein
VKDLAGPRRHEALILEMLRQCDPIWMRVAKHDRVVEHAGHRRIAAVQQRGARRVAKRELAIRAIEPHAAGGQPIDIRCLDSGRAITGHFRPPIVRGDEQNVEFRRSFGPCRLVVVLSLGGTTSRHEHAAQKRPEESFHTGCSPIKVLGASSQLADQR